MVYPDATLSESHGGVDGQEDARVGRGILTDK
jgi:hypothetical protein